MSALGSSELQYNESYQPAGRIAFLPFSGKLSVDEELKLSNEKFKEKINDFFKNKTLTPLSQLRATPPFPTPYMLAQFANKAYEDYETDETDVQYETHLALPNGWKLLTTASNSRKKNGYFGAAYWHPEHQQVVIAHRGTDFTNVGALWTDLKGVLFKCLVPQVDSASTFANKVAEVLREINRVKGVSFQLFFTGHSLGGWLAQVTTLTTQYLKKEESLFLKSYNDIDSYHPHTVVFDSPGCKDMLSEMADKLDVRLDGRSIDLEHLDITSYLSAPNLINTCKSHVGTVYRIFTDLSDMGWMEKNTPLYNLATHSMDKIVEAFDPVTGQVCKDEKGKLKVHVVVDWPISTGLTGGEEYKNFFNRAKQLNNYHPDIKDVAFKLRHYNPIRYQTKLYIARENRVSVLSEEEQEFLQCYCWLREWPEFFKPKELFPVTEDNLGKTEQILQGFEVENDTVRCTDASTLQALIAYVKRLLQLFPEIKEKTKLALSSDEVTKRVYQFETRRYVERINQSPLKFNCDCLRFGEFLESEQQKVLHLQVVKGGEWTGLIKVYQVLQKNGNISEGQYILLSVERLLMINQMMDISKLIQSTVTPYLLLIACEDNQHLEEETREVIRTLFYTMKLKPNIKIIFIIPLGGSIFAFLQNLGKKLFGNGFVRGTEPLTWSDLTNSAQEKLLEKSVKFQGAKVSLNKLMSAESPAAKFLSLGDLLEENKLKIAYPVPVANAYNEGYYIGRIFCHQNAIKQEIFNDIHVTDSRVYLASSEQEYKQLCQLNPKSSVHWLEKDKTGNILWQQSQGSLDTVRRYIDTDRSHTFTDGDLVELLEKAEQQRLMLISDTAGMGKSTVLTHLSKEIKRTFPAKWVVRIDLNDHTDVLKVLKQGQIDKEKAIEFVSEKMLKLKPGLEMELFKHCCEKKQKVGIVIMLDGFDEISPFYKEIVFDLLQALRQTAVEELWVTTRPHLRQELEDKLVQLSFTLQPFSEKNKIEFLTKFWSLKDWFTEMNSEKEEERRERLRNYADELLKKLARSVADKGRELTGIPLQCRMLAEAFDKEVRTFCQSSESKPELQYQLDLFWLYGRFIERKYDIFQEEKLQVRVSNVAGIGQREHHLKSITDDYQLLALKVLFTEEQVALFKNNSECTFLVEELTRTGIVQVNCDGNLHFIHRTFAEYYVADCMVNCLNKGCKTSQQVQTFILKDIFMKRDYSVIRVFIDGLLSSKKPSEEMLKQYGYRIDELKNDCLLHMVALEGNANIIGFLLDSARAGGHKYTARSLLTKQDRRKRTAWFIAAQWGKVESLQRIWDWAKDNLTTEEKKVEFLLATDSDGNIAWHRATEIGAIDVLQKIWELAIDSLTTEEIKSTLLFSTDSRGNTVLQLAARRGKLEVLQKVWEWVKDSLKTEEIESKLLLNTDRCGNTAWHLAAKWGGLQVMQKIWDLAKENLTTEEIQNKMLLAKDIRGNTAWHMAAFWGKPGVLQKIWEWAKESLTTEDIKDKLLLATDIEGNTAWQLASKGGKIDLLRKINDLAKDCLTTEQINSMLLVPTDRD